MAGAQYLDQPRARDDQDALLPGATLTFSSGGQPVHVYADAQMTRFLTNPLVADAAARFPQFHLDPDVAYRAILRDAEGNEIFDENPYDVYPGTDTLAPTDDSDRPLSLATLTFYYYDTTELAPIYTNAGMGTPLSNPLVANTDGEFAAVYLDEDIDYRVLLRTAEGVLIYDVDVLPFAEEVIPSVPVEIVDRSSDVVVANGSSFSVTYGDLDDYTQADDPVGIIVFGLRSASTTGPSSITAGGVAANFRHRYSAIGGGGAGGSSYNHLVVALVPLQSVDAVGGVIDVEWTLTSTTVRVSMHMGLHVSSTSSAFGSDFDATTNGTNAATLELTSAADGANVVAGMWQSNGDLPLLIVGSVSGSYSTQDAGSAGSFQRMGVGYQLTGSSFTETVAGGEGGPPGNFAPGIAFVLEPA